MTQSCNFLDLIIYKSPSFPTTGILSPKIYYKEMNTMSFHLGYSYMSKHILRSIAIRGILNLLYCYQRNTESPILYRHYTIKLVKQFKERKYSKYVLREIPGIKHNKRWEILSKSRKRSRWERPLPFKTTYTKYRPSLNSIFHRRWQLAYNDRYLYNLLPNPPNTLYKNRKTLKAILSAKQMKFQDKGV